MLTVLRTDIMCFFILSFIAYSHFSVRRNRNKAHQFFSALIILSMLVLILGDLTIWALNATQIPETFINIMNIFYLQALMTNSAFVLLYAINLLAEELPQRILEIPKRVFFVPVLIAAVVILFVPLEVDVANGMIYTKGTQATIAFLLVLLYLLAILVGLCITWKKLDIKKRKIIGIALLFELMLSFVQFYFPDHIITGLAVTILVLGLYLLLENPDANLVEELQYEKNRANAANSAKSTFIAHVSHEVRTPINAIIGMDEMILRETKDTEVLQYAQDIHQAAQSLYAIVNNVLDVSKMESGKLEVMPVQYELRGLIDECVNLIKGRAKAKGIEFRIQVNPNLPNYLYGDDVRIRQIITNLLSNAVNYTNEGFVLLIVDGRVNVGTIDLYIEVKDTGNGIKEQDLARLTVAFERIEERRNRHIEGTGLGLNISSQLIRFMGGTLKVESNYGKGSRFFFEISQGVVGSIPIGNYQPQVKKKIVKSSATFTAPKVEVLLVDDNAMNRKVFKHLLTRTEIQVTDVDSGIKALEMVQKHSYHIIFLDHMMPEMDGIETFRRMKDIADNQSRNARVIMLTANAVNTADNIYLQEGFDGYLSKPILSHDLEQTILANVSSELIHYENGRKNTEPLPDVDGIDWRIAYDHLVNRETILKVVKEFAYSIDSDIHKTIDYYEDIHQEGNLDSFRIKVHSIKSATALFGAMTVSENAKILERAAREQNLELIKEKTIPFISELQTLKSALTPLIEKSDKDSRMALDVVNIRVLLKTLKNALSETDVDSADDTMELLAMYDYEDKAQQIIKQLKSAVVNLDEDLVNALADELENLLVDTESGR